MKYNPPIVAMLIATTVMSCNKDAANSHQNQSSVSVSQQSNAVTGYQVQKSIYANVNANIGGYLEALPVNYLIKTDKHYPLLITLHGQGELGNGTTELYKVKINAVPRLLENHQFPSGFTVGTRTFSFIVISPQFKKWPQAVDVNDMINYAITKYRVDITRMYVNGLSMGGGANWDDARLYGKRLAAVVPICGASYPNIYKGQAIAATGVAVWAFHNSNDPSVPPFYTKDYITYINKSSPVIPAKITIFSSYEHDAWTKATDPSYTENGKNIYQWMLSYKRKR